MRKILLSTFIALNYLTGCTLLSPEQSRGPAQQATDSTAKLADATSKKGTGLGEQYYKFSVFLDNAGHPTKLVYQNVDKFEFHADFLATQPEFRGLKRSQIDELTYSGGTNRRALLGVLTQRFADDGIRWQRFSLIMNEPPQAEQVIETHRLLLASAVGSEFSGPLEVELLTHQIKGFTTQEEAVRRAKIDVFIPPAEQGATAYTDAWNYGVLEWVGSENELGQKLASGRITERTVIVTDQNLREFPAVAGVISAVPLTPASHAVLLGQMYAAPIVYVPDAAERFRPLVGRSIYLNAHAPPGSHPALRKVDYVLSPGEKDLATLQQLRLPPSLDVKIEEREETIRNAGELSFANIPAYGGKSSQMGIILRALPGNSLGGSTAIPLAYFKKFLAAARVSDGALLGEYIRAKTASIADPRTGDTQTKATLAEIRAAIIAAKIPAEVIAPIRQALTQAYPGASVRLFLRSSSNAEDGAEFNGAGLYDSTKAWLRGGPEDELEKGLKEVWSSLYTDRGFIARRRFQADESKVGMAVLAQEFLKSEGANGIALIHIAAGAKKPSVEIVTYKDDAQVTAGNGEIRAEIVTLNSGGIRLEQPYEGLSKARTLLREKQYLELGQHMEALAQAYGAPAKEVHIESEWKLMRNPDGDKLVVLQVRPVPQRRRARLPDGSAAFFLMPPVLDARFEDQHPLAAHVLFNPRNIRIKMKSFGHKDFLASNLTLDEASFQIQGHEYVLKNVKGRPGTGGHPDFPIVAFPLPNAHVPGLRLEVQIAKSVDRNVYGPFHDTVSISFGSDSKDFARFGDSPYGALSSRLEQDQFRKLTPFLDDRVIGTGNLTINIVGPRKAKIDLSQVKTSGQGDLRQTSIGQAAITGIIGRPIKLPKLACAYGANHHEGFETYFFDLLGDPSLSATEKAEITKQGRYLNLESGTASLVAGDGRKPSKIGTWGDGPRKPRRGGDED